MDLFSEHTETGHQPLAYRMRPQNLDEYIGQDHIVGNGRLLRRAIQADQLSSVIFYGPPGTGKTTLARVIANTTKSHFSTLNAVLSGVKELRTEIAAAKERLSYYQKRTILFVDEVHRWNKSQQDALLPWVENGTIILIGATTENPYFEVNAALVSRSRIFQLRRLTEKDLFAIAHAALQNRDRGYGEYQVSFEEGALEHIVSIANGDARSLLNALELAVETTPESFPPVSGKAIVITKEAAEESIQQKAVLYDKEGDYHYDVISAFIKSIRGSDPDAVLYWLARMVRAGEDPKYIFRRMLISAGEDVGLADPNAIGIVESSAAAFDRVGLPEGRFHLAHAALYLATAPKSNSSLGFFSALKSIEIESDSEVPNHLKDGSRDKKGFGHGVGYQYPHAYKDHWVAQQYLPNALQGSVFYEPSDQGYEKSIRTGVEQHREAQSEASSEKVFSEILTYSPPNMNRDRWLDRLLSGRGKAQEDIRERLFSSLELQRHHRILVIERSTGMLTWEACRRTPEGGVSVLCTSKGAYEHISQYSRRLTALDRPDILQTNTQDPLGPLETSDRFEAVIGQQVFTHAEDKQRLADQLFDRCSEGAELSLCEIIPSACQRLSELAQSDEDRQILSRIEGRIYADMQRPEVNFTIESLKEALDHAKFKDVRAERQQITEQRRLTAETIDRWMRGTYARYSVEEERPQLERAGRDLLGLYEDTTTAWRITLCYLYAQR